ncbi:hypothetical protein niasHS_001673 [Heterodera schachtii]|uniref:PH domain-containing protein n=1 Tax=Heterodera schachtii TaxID=97005 RepID=A0ABD2KBQ3_HETSC
MFHHFAPIGLPQNPAAFKPTKGQHEQIERSINGAVDEILNTNGGGGGGALGTQTAADKKAHAKPTITYNLAHPDTVILLKSLDAFFAHGLLKTDKCYWAFAREFIPSAERAEMRVRWACRNRRALSLAWLKDSLNRANLHFQLLSFIACADTLKRAHYERNACMRNTALLKRICVRVDQLTELQFNIEPPYVFHPEDTPIALPRTMTSATTAVLMSTAQFFDGTMSPIGGSSSCNSSLMNGIAGGGGTVTQQQQRKQQVRVVQQQTPNVPMNIRRRMTPAQNVALPKSFVGSFYETATPRSSTFLDGLVDDLPEVDLSVLGPSTADQIVRSHQEQSYILDQMLHNKRKSYTNFDTLLADDEEEEEQEHKRQQHLNNTKQDKEQNQSVRSYVPEDPETGATTTTIGGDDVGSIGIIGANVQQQDQAVHGVGNNPQQQLQQQQQIAAVPSTSSLNSSSTEFKFGATTSSAATREDDELSELEDTGTALVEGEVLLEGHEKIALGLQVCVDDVETVQRMFQVFVGHATGHPMVRYLLLTNKFLYLLAVDGKAGSCDAFDVVDEREFGTISPANAVVEEWPAKAFEQNQQQLQQPQHHHRRQPVPTTLPVEAKKFDRLHVLPLCDLDHLTVGVDAQVLCFHSKRRMKFRCSPNQTATVSGANQQHHHQQHEQKLLAVETGSRQLGKTIAHCVRRAVVLQHSVWLEREQRRRRQQRQHQQHRRGSVALANGVVGEEEAEMTEAADELAQASLTAPQQQLYVSTSHSSHLALLLKRFLRSELGMQQLEIVHHSLVYWHQSDAPRLQHNQQQMLLQQRRQLEEARQKQQNQSPSSTATTADSAASTTGAVQHQQHDGGGGNNLMMMECYMSVRELYQRGWTWRPVGSSEWKQSYVVLSGSKLYLFSDSTYKFAQRCVNIRDTVEQVYQAELVNDVEQYVFQLDFADNARVPSSGANGEPATDDSGGPLLSALQFSCPSVATMQKWIGTLSLALSQSDEQPLPTACMAVLTETHVVLAQEGVNCLVDGFMRSLSAFHVHEIAELCAIRTEFNSALVLRRDNGMDEWLLFREIAELDRLVERLRQQWNLPVQECSAEENLLNPSFNQLFLNCVRMPDLWHCSADQLATMMAS